MPKLSALLFLCLTASCSLAHDNAYPATITRVVDGDTVDAVADLGFGVKFKDRFRLLRVDAPEMRTPEGRALQVQMSEKLLGKRVLLISAKRDKWRRWLAEVVCDGVNISDWLLREKLAEPYPRR